MTVGELIIILIAVVAAIYFIYTGCSLALDILCDLGFALVGLIVYYLAMRFGYPLVKESITLFLNQKIF